MAYRDPPSSMATQNAGLEVDSCQDGLQYNYDSNPLPEAYNETFQPDGKQELYPVPPARPVKRISGLPNTIFWLSAMLALGWILAIVAAAVAGSLAMKRQSATCSVNPKTGLGGRNSSTCENSGPNNQTCAPTTDCAKLTSPYVSVGNVQFDVHCETDYSSNNLMSVYVVQFEDCISACASYNLNFDHPNSSCSTATYDTSLVRGSNPSAYQDGNCFLKGLTGIEATSKSVTSSAIVVRN